jgi:hypothetical protein
MQLHSNVLCVIGNVNIYLWVGLCHDGMARPQVADGGTASSMEGSCEYIEQAVADRLQGVILQFEVSTRC